MDVSHLLGYVCIKRTEWVVKKVHVRISVHSPRY